MRPVLETPRLRLRELAAYDLDFVAAMLAHPEVMRFYPRPYSREEAEGWLKRQIERYAQHGHGLWLVEERGGAKVGQVGLVMQQVDGTDEPEVGYLVHRPFWRRGYASEAAIAARDYAFRERGYPYVISLIRPENEPSQGVARAMGMTPWKNTMRGDMPHIVFRADRPVT
jgi:RimJ/RimL family protein N-acetyltransferase